MTTHWITMQIPHDQEDVAKVLTEIFPLVINSEVGVDIKGADTKFVFLINKDDWDKLAEIALKYTLNVSIVDQGQEKKNGRV